MAFSLDVAAQLYYSLFLQSQHKCDRILQTGGIQLKHGLWDIVPNASASFLDSRNIFLVLELHTLRVTGA